jgi:putative flippase GtrA
LGGECYLITQLIKFGIVGILATALDYSVFLFLINVGCYYLLANFFAFLFASVIGYFFSLRYVWSKKPTPKNLIGYYLVQIIGLASTSLLLYIMSNKIPIEVAKLISILIVPIQTFLLNKFLIFRK